MCFFFGSRFPPSKICRKLFLILLERSFISSCQACMFFLPLDLRQPLSRLESILTMAGRNKFRRRTRMTLFAFWIIFSNFLRFFWGQTLWFGDRLLYSYQVMGSKLEVVWPGAGLLVAPHDFTAELPVPVWTLEARRRCSFSGSELFKNWWVKQITLTIYQVFTRCWEVWSHPGIWKLCILFHQMWGFAEASRSRNTAAKTITTRSLPLWFQNLEKHHWQKPSFQLEVLFVKQLNWISFLKQSCPTQPAQLCRLCAIHLWQHWQA